MGDTACRGEVQGAELVGTRRGKEPKVVSSPSHRTSAGTEQLLHCGDVCPAYPRCIPRLANLVGRWPRGLRASTVCRCGAGCPGFWPLVGVPAGLEPVLGI